MIAKRRHRVEPRPIERRCLEHRAEAGRQRCQRQEVVQQCRGQQCGQVRRHAVSPARRPKREVERDEGDHRRKQVRLLPLRQRGPERQAQQVRQHRADHHDRHAVHVAGVDRIRHVAHEPAELQLRQHDLHHPGKHEAERGEGQQQRQKRAAVGTEEARIGAQPAEQRRQQQRERRTRSAQQRSAAAGERRYDGGDARATRTKQETLGRLLGAQPRKGQQAVAAFDRRQHQRGGQSARDVPSSNAMASEQRTQPTRPRARVAHSSPEVFRRHLPTTIITCCRPTAARRSRRSIARRPSSLWTIRTARSMPTDGTRVALTTSRVLVMLRCSTKRKAGGFDVNSARGSSNAEAICLAATTPLRKFSPVGDWQVIDRLRDEHFRRAGRRVRLRGRPGYRNWEMMPRPASLRWRSSSLRGRHR